MDARPSRWPTLRATVMVASYIGGWFSMRVLIGIVRQVLWLKKITGTWW